MFWINTLAIGPEVGHQLALDQGHGLRIQAGDAAAAGVEGAIAAGGIDSAAAGQATRNVAELLPPPAARLARARKAARSLSVPMLRASDTHSSSMFCRWHSAQRG
ncbi:MAG: hypothetical protein U1F68_15290 [Gammaproteobacteria bacterium]